MGRLNLHHITSALLRSLRRLLLFSRFNIFKFQIIGIWLLSLLIFLFQVYNLFSDFRELSDRLSNQVLMFWVLLPDFKFQLQDFVLKLFILVLRSLDLSPDLGLKLLIVNWLLLTLVYEPFNVLFHRSQLSLKVLDINLGSAQFASSQLSGIIGLLELFL